MQSMLRKTGVAAMAWLIAGSANAGIMEVDITETLDVGSATRILGTVGSVVGPGPELTLADEILSTASLCGAATVDFSDSANTFTIGAVDGDCFYNSAFFEFSNIVADGALASVSAVSGSGTLFQTAVTPIIEITALGFSVHFEVDSSFTFNSSEQGTAEFTYALRTVDPGPDPVPAPATLALMGLGLLGLRLRRKA